MICFNLVCSGVSRGLLQYIVHDHIFLSYNNNNKIVASTFSYAYSWVFDRSLVSHSTFPKNLLAGEHEEQQHSSGHQPQQLG
jgi:hypothetical protein